jgi:hypothetical protein
MLDFVILFTFSFTFSSTRARKTAERCIINILHQSTGTMNTYDRVYVKDLRSHGHFFFADVRQSPSCRIDVSGFPERMGEMKEMHTSYLFDKAA